MQNLNNQALKVDEVTKVPLNRDTRMKQLLQNLNNKQKEGFLPESGFKFRLGPFIYEVTVVNIGDMRFSAKLYDVIIEGIND